MFRLRANALISDEDDLEKMGAIFPSLLWLLPETDSEDNTSVKERMACLMRE